MMSLGKGLRHCIDRSRISQDLELTGFGRSTLDTGWSDSTRVPTTQTGLYAGIPLRLWWAVCWREPSSFHVDTIWKAWDDDSRSQKLNKDPLSLRLPRKP